MEIYVQKLSIPAEEWTINVDSSDYIEGLKALLAFQELPTVYDTLKIHLFYNGTELQDGQTLQHYNITKFSHITSSYDQPDPYAPWGGFANWQRLRLLEYV